MTISIHEFIAREQGVEHLEFRCASSAVVLVVRMIPSANGSTSCDGVSFAQRSGPTRHFLAFGFLELTVSNLIKSTTTPHGKSLADPNVWATQPSQDRACGDAALSGVPLSRCGSQGPTVAFGLCSPPLSASRFLQGREMTVSKGNSLSPKHKSVFERRLRLQPATDCSSAHCS
jgi:hypothetical protein